MDVGVVGLGRMGCAIARRLIEAKHRVTVYNRTRSRAEQLQSSGAIIADSPAAASTGDAVITMLADDAAVLAMALGKDGVLQGMHKKTTHISMSTITVALSDQLATAHVAAGRHYLAAPVFGRPDAAAAGKLFVVAHHVEVALLGIELHREPARIALGVRAAALACNGRKACGDIGACARLEDLGLGVARDVGHDLEMAEGAAALGVRLPLRDLLPVEVRHLLQEVMVV